MGNALGNTRLAPFLFCVAFVVGACRGGYLFGWPAGLMLGGALAFSAFLLSDAFLSKSRFKTLGIAAASCFFCFVLAVIVAPTWLSQDVQYSIDNISNERKMRSELHDVFDDDVRFSSLRSSFTQLKCMNITMSGSLPDASSLDDVRAAIADNCPTVCEMALVSWGIRLNDSGERIETNDGRMGQYGSGDNDAG